MKKKTIPLLLLTVLLLFSFVPQTKAITLNLKYPVFGGIDINNDNGQSLNQIIAWFYYFIVGISGFSAFFMFVWGGFQWTYSQGDASKIGEAKDKLTSAVIGVLIVLSAYLILQVINPDLITLSLPSINKL